MTLESLKTLLLTVDAKITRYKHLGSGNYTVWREYGTKPLGADNSHGEVIYRVQIDRFTKKENDTIAASMTEKLNERDDIAFQYLVDYELDTGYIHHIWDCEVV